MDESARFCASARRSSHLDSHNVAERVVQILRAVARAGEAGRSVLAAGPRKNQTLSAVEEDKARSSIADTVDARLAAVGEAAAVVAGKDRVHLDPPNGNSFAALDHIRSHLLSVESDCMSVSERPGERDVKAGRGKEAEAEDDRRRGRTLSE